MKHESTAESLALPSTTSSRDVLTGILRDGAQRLLTQAIEAEVAEFIDSRAHLRNADGHRAVVRNGHLPARSLVTGVGSIEVKQPRVRDRRPPHEGMGGRERFTSRILPPYLRKTRAIEELIPWLYLKGISTNDFPEALAALVGTDAGGLSPSTITRLVESWQAEHQAWCTRSLADKQYVYVWADGIHFNIRLAPLDRQCMLVLMGATPEGRKELIAIVDGHRESAESWKELLLDVKSRGMVIDPKLATGDGALGFWKALPQVYPTTRVQRCWVHKTANVLDKMPKRLQPQAKRMLHDICMAETRANANRAFDLFLDTYRAKHTAATACLEKDRQALLAFYEFPAEHWIHVRTTNPIESVFATVRLRHDKTKGNGSRVACLTMVFKLMESASKRWRALNGSALIPEVIAGVQFTDGIKSQRIAA